MQSALSALADPVRWRFVNLLAERPRSVGVLARIAQVRQPSATKHLQALERAGLVTSQRSGQRRVYALQSDPLRDLAAAITRLAEAAAEVGGPRSAYERYGLQLRAERLAATETGWADNRSFTFVRSLPAGPEMVWRHLTEASLLARWWTPDDLRVSDLDFDARPGGRIVHEYRDLEDADDTDVVVGRAEGVVDEARPCERLVYRLSPLLPDGSVAFTAHVDYSIHGADQGADLEVMWWITDSTVDSADFIAGIEIGFGQSLDKLAAVLAGERNNTDTTNTRSTK